MRLVRGDMDTAQIFNDDPVAQAVAFQATGFRWLHIVDLDGAVGGHAVNEVAVKAILRNLKVPAQLGGGIRDMAGIERWLEAGVARVILGTVAVQNAELVRDAARRFPKKIAVGIDAKAGHVAIQGWAQETDVSAMQLAKRFEDAGVACIIYTDIARDGTGVGVNVEETVAIAGSVSVPVIASGGIGSLDDLKKLKSKGHPNIRGVICGRALYDGRLDGRAALALMERT